MILIYIYSSLYIFEKREIRFPVILAEFRISQMCVLLIESKAFSISIKITKIFCMLFFLIHSCITLKLKIGSNTDLPCISSNYNSVKYPFNFRMGLILS